MFSSFRNRFGIPGAISVIALVFAMFGGAYAASNSGDGATASAKKKSAKGPRGPKGPKGAPGAAGPAGPAGPAGAKGDAGAAGADGEKGATGADGANGQSVTTAVEPPFGECGDQEGVELTSASGTDYVCNGEKGAKGDKGAPWTPDNQLPSGATLTGAWAAGETSEEQSYVPIPFTLPLAAPLTAQDPINPATERQVHYIKSNGKETFIKYEGGIPVGLDEAVSAKCPGTAAAPSADPGHLCIYENQSFNLGMIVSNINIVKAGQPGNGASTAGAILRLESAGVEVHAYGTWAVTAP